MSSPGQIIGAIVGAVVGFMIGGPSMVVQGAQWGSTIGGAIDPPKPPAQHSFGARLTDLSSQTGTYGQAIPRIYGSMATLGNIFWLENNQLKEVATTEEVESGGKGGGGGEESTNTTYAYYATFAVGLCEGPIQGIRRIWIGSQLFYDAGTSDLQSIIASNQKASTFTFYNGSDTQVANSRMQATLGSANTPAYRGLAYIVFYDLALKDFNNSLMSAQVKVEVVEKVIQPTVILDKLITGYLPTTYFIGYPLYFDDEKVVVAQGKWINNYPSFATAHMVEVYYNGTIINKESGATYTANYYPPVIRSDNPSIFYNNNSSAMLGAPNNVPLSGGSIGSLTKIGNITCGIIQFTLSSTSYQEVLWWSVGGGSAQQLYLSNTTFAATTDGTYIYVLNTTTLYKYDTYGNIISQIASPMALDNKDNKIRVYGEHIYVADLTSTSLGVYKTNKNLLESWSNKIYVGPKTYGSNTDDFYIINDLFVFCSVGTDSIWLQIFSINNISINTVSLSSIVQSECLKSKILTTNDIDVSSLTSQINGYRITNAGSLRSAIEPVQGAYPFDVYQQGYKIKFKPRGNSSVATIPSNLLGVRSSGDTTVLLKEERTNDSQLPSKISISYFDKDREYDRGEQYSERISRPSNNAISIEMPLVLDATEAAKMTDVLLYMYWMEKSEFEFTLPASYSNLEPTDIITITTPQESYELRLTSIGYNSDTIIECKGRINKATAYTSTVTGETGLSTGVTMQFSTPMASLIMDLPCINSDMNRACIGIAGNSYSGSNWSGGVVYRSDDNGQTWKVVQALSSSSTIGTAINTIGTWNSTRIDYNSTLQVSMMAGTLSSVTLSQACNGSNCFAYGVNGRWEIIHALTCTLQEEGTYILSDLLRGRAGTEHNTNNHAVGDYLVYLNSGAYSPAVESSLIGLARNYKGASFGYSLSDANNISFTYTGMNLECLSPVYLNGNRHPTTNDWTLNWIRRTRVGGEWKDYVDATLSETSEAYDVEVYTSGYATLKRTISVTSATATYTSANQVTDFGSNQATLYLKIYQKSTTVGQGIPLIASITR